VFKNRNIYIVLNKFNMVLCMKIAGETFSLFKMRKRIEEGIVNEK